MANAVSADVRVMQWGYGTGFNDFNQEQLQLCITWMLASALSWGSLANLLSIKLSHRFGE